MSRPSSEEVQAIVLAFLIVGFLAFAVWLFSGCEPPEPALNAEGESCDEMIRQVIGIGASCEGTRVALDVLTARMPECRAIFGDGGIGLDVNVCPRKDAGHE